MIAAGAMHRNGHARCGGCLMLVNRCAGGRRQRKAERWAYSGRHRLGWVCESCARWALYTQRVAARSPTDLVGSRHKVSPDPPGGIVRGFGLKKKRAPSLSRRLRNRARTTERKGRRKTRRAENRAAGRPSDVPDLDTLSPSAYLRYQLAERAREKRRRA